MLQIRRINPADLTCCALLDSACAAPEPGWTVADFQQFFAVPSQGGFLALWKRKPVGLLLYQADRDNHRLYLVRLAVAPGWRRRRIGTRLVQHLRLWLRPLPDVEVWALVHEGDLALQCFLRANAFRATRICKNRFDEGSSDGYLFELPEEQSVLGRKAVQPS